MCAASASPSIVWFRNDLRLRDHAALSAAAKDGPIVAVYVLDEDAAGAWAPGGASLWWLHHSLAALGAALDAKGVPLILRRGRAEDALGDIARATGAGVVHAGVAVEPWARAQTRRVADALGDGRLRSHRTVTLFDLDTIRTKTGGVYGVYTPFSRACRARELPPAATAPRPTAPYSGAAPRSDRLDDWGLLPTRPDWAAGLRETWRPGEDGARARLKSFLNLIDGYDRARNLPGEQGTSMLSPHLHWGEISPAQVWRAAYDHAHGAGKGLDTYLNEIIWREFASYLLWHHPTLPETPLRPEFARMPWRHDRPALRAWRRGRTGVPIVDAGMRQLWQTGWMHNRVRMIVGSFLIKHLLLPWQDGEAWFWDTLCDADLGSNSASWQWVAGSGADAAPFFRVFNPVLQGEKFDPEGAYVRRFVPELERLDARHVHAPWTAPDDALRAAGVVLGGTYPKPIVDLAEGRARALAAYRKIGASAE